MKNLIIILSLITCSMSAQDDVGFIDHFKGYLKACTVEIASVYPTMTDVNISTFDLIRGGYEIDSENYLIIDRKGSVLWPKRNSCSSKLEIAYIGKPKTRYMVGLSGITKKETSDISIDQQATISNIVEILKSNNVEIIFN